MKKFLLFAILITIGLLFHFNIKAQTNENSPILFIYDASGSMWGKIDGKTKKEIAATVLANAVNDLPHNQKIGLMAYGHRHKRDCSDIETLVDLHNTAKDAIIQNVQTIKSIGKTPLAQSATIAINSLKESKSKATIILITDGIESCDGKICEVVAAAKLEGIEFKLHIIGFGLKNTDLAELKCAANSGDGQYYDAADANQLGQVINEATSASVDKPKGNFSLFATKNGQSLDAWVRAFKSGTRKDIDFKRTYKDTAFLYLPRGKYDIEIQPLENTDLAAKTIQLIVVDDKVIHQNISFDGAIINVYTSNNQVGCDASVLIKDSQSGKSVAHTRTYGKTQRLEINSGTYDITFKALRIKGLETSYTYKNYSIIGGENKSISHNFKTGIANIGVQTIGGELIDATVNLSKLGSGEYIAGNRTYTSINSNPKEFVLNPGDYMVKIVTLGKHKGHKKTFNITVVEGKTVEEIITF